MDWKRLKYLADENIDRELVSYLSLQSFDIKSVWDCDLQGKTDEDVMQVANAESRVVITHDSDFGTLIFREETPFTGIIYLRPGHIEVSFSIETLETIFNSNLEAIPPFILIAQRNADKVKIRLRNQ